MTENNLGKRPIALLKSSLTTLLSNPPLLFPFLCVGFIQLFLLEIIFFSTRHPLNVFFGPIIKRLEGEIFLHYPFNFLVVMKWWQNSLLQSTLYIFVTSLFIGMAIVTIEAININRTINYSAFLRKALRSYVHIFVAASLTVATMFFFSSLHGVVLGRAMAIKSVSGKFFLLKQAVLWSAPYVNLLVAVFVTSIFIFLIPIIILDGKKITSALVTNFRVLGRSWGVTLGIIFLSSLLYIPAILLKTFSPMFQKNILPELWPLIPLFTILSSLFIDAIQYTAITTLYLLTKEEK